jgi:Baseplate J-like protein
MSCTQTGTCDCGCCSGTSVQTPQVDANRPGLPAVSYRVGSWATFKESMLARLSSSDYPALTALKTRADDDFTIAFLDATSVVFDVLTFYQERLANESYLRTAGQLRSLIELSRLIGYQPAPGVAAACYVAFSLKTAPGQTPDPSAPAITIPQGTQMQSVPAQGQKPQTFETSADIPAKPDWNALPVQTGVVWSPQINDTSVYLQGTATQLQPGDLILVVGDERTTHNDSENWDVREITAVRPDGLNNVTYVEWSEGLGYPPDGIQPAQQHPKFYAFRQRAALFGYNAVDPILLFKDTLGALQDDDLVTEPASGSTTPPEWNFAAPSPGALIDLDGLYAKVISGGWITLIKPDAHTSRSPAGFVKLYQVESVTAISRSAYGASSKVTRAAADTGAYLGEYYTDTRETSALVQSELLDVPLQPFVYPLYGSSVDLQDLRPDLSGATVIAISGKRQKVKVKATPVPLQFHPDDSSGNVPLEIGAILTLTDPTPFLNVSGPLWKSGSGPLTLSVEDASGRPGTVLTDLMNLVLIPSVKDDPFVSECALVSSVSSGPGSPANTIITLQSPLMNCYERKTAKVNANVVLATNGQTVGEVLGNGSASTPNQNFVLKQSPLTYVQAPTPTGRQSTLEVRVGGIKWQEVPTLFEQTPSSQVFATMNQSDATTEVLFGDGVEGATLPTGQNNLQAKYRIGSGSAGNVGAGTLTTLVDRPLGVSGVTNPQSATGGQDAQSINDIRANAPQTVLTLGRAVSIADYQSYASTFAGISKSYAIWIPSGPGRGVFLTVAGVNGESLQSSPTLGNLVTSLKSYGNPLIPVTAQSFLETLFQLSADVKYDPKYDQPTVQAAVLEALSNTYSFANRTFGEGVSADEVASVIQAVPGVVAVNVKGLKRFATSTAGDLAGGGTFSIAKLNAWLAQKITYTLPASDSPTRIRAFLPVPSLTSLPHPAEILVLDPDPNAVTLGVMS